MKIVFFISTLTSGGAERVLSNLANYFSEKKLEVIIITSSRIEDDFYDINSTVKRFSLYNVKNKNLNTYKVFFKNMKKIRNIIKLESPDMLVSFMSQSNIFLLLATIGLKFPIVISERNNPRLNSLNFVWSYLRELTFPFADAIVVQTESVKKEYSYFIRKKLTVIANPIDRKMIDGKQQLPEYILKKPTIVALGRLHKLKGMDLLIKAFAIFHKQNTNWNLTIIGEGKEREDLEKLVELYNLEEYVYMPGKFKQPIPIIKQADIYVLPSRTEGFPNALCEAMSIGLPCISFDCPVGPSEIIMHDVNGKLVEAENIEQLASEISILANNDDQRNKISLEAKKLKTELDITKISALWFKLFKKILDKRKRISK